MKFRVFVITILLAGSLSAQMDLSYYLPGDHKFNPNIPTPEEVLGFQIGEFHLSPDQVLRYFEALDSKSDRVSIEITGYSHENRPLLLLIITSPENQENLNNLREDHLQSIDPFANEQLARDEKLFVQLGYSVHGNEPSGVNAAPLVAYYLAASEQDDVVKLLEKTVVLIDPMQNPDGINRFASWVNSHKSLNNNPDPNSIEFRESWPGSRTNHYWYDLNRDWLLLQHPESQARIQAFHKWKPQVVTDHHEMGGSSTFFFQPGVKSRANPIIPESNYILTQKIGMYHAAALDEIGSLYWTEETFDDFYFGKGAAYPDINGSIGILFEQAASRGHAQENAYGVITFPFTIRNQVAVSLSTLKGAFDNRKELLFHQPNYYKTALEEAVSEPIKGYIFGDNHDPMRTNMMIDLLLQHQIEVHEIRRDAELANQSFKAAYSFVVKTEQAQYRLIRTLWEKVTQFNDSTFYDISGWTLPLAFNMPYAPLNAKELDNINLGRVLDQAPSLTGKMSTKKAQQAYIFEWDPYLAPQALYKILDAGILTKVSGSPIVIQTDKDESRSFDRGSILIPMQGQTLSPDKIQSLLYELAMENGLDIYASQSAYISNGTDLGSRGYSFVSKPKILTLTGGRTSSREIGQIWHILDTRFSIPVTLADINRFSGIDLSRYNTILLAGGSYSEFNESDIEKLKSWVRQGGKIISLKSASSFLKRAGLINYSAKAPGEYPQVDSKFLPFEQRRKDYIGKSIPGSIFEAKIDRSHPIGYGYNEEYIPIFKNSTDFVAPGNNPYGNPLYFTQNPVLSGFINSQNLEGLSESVVMQSNGFGRGVVICFFDDPLFRGYFAGEHKLLMNAIFFGHLF